MKKNTYQGITMQMAPTSFSELLLLRWAGERVGKWTLERVSLSQIQTQGRLRV